MNRRIARHIAGDEYIWALALGYFLTYIPYAFMTKASTIGALPGVPAASGMVILPASAIATLICLYLFVASLGWWRHIEWRVRFGVPLPHVRRAALLSGICTAVIVGTTTLAYSFHGISIVFMMVLMRGGVLLIARGTDLVTGRKVRIESIVAFILTFAAFFVALADQSGPMLTPPAAICIGAYLTGYLCRFNVMHRLSKSYGQDERIRYFVEEQAVAMPVLVLACAAWALIGGDAAVDFRRGFELFGGDPILLPAILVGVFYASLYIFGTLIYLNPREYTFCVPVNRAASILSGIVATFILALFFGQPAPSSRDLLGAAILIVALLVLGLPALHAAYGRRRAAPRLERLFIFVCAGNTARSPIAQAICTAEMAARLGLSREKLESAGVRVISAGLKARVGKPMKPEAIAALEVIGVPAHDHEARQITPDMLDRAAMICCMTEEQRLSLLELSPSASGRVRRLAPEGDLDEPVGHEATLAFARRVQDALRLQLGDFMTAVSV